jgi:tRNA threonylcarbamoyladenosine biosynthesis protein TsaE
MKEKQTKFLSKSEKQTRKIGEDLGSKLKKGGIIALHGNLGAGKTVFVKGIARGLGIKDHITSPTFIFWRAYNISKNRLRHFCHVDLYRLPKPGALLNIGIEEYWERDDAVCLIEWAERAKHLPKSKLIYSVKISIIDQNTREIVITSL